MEWNRWNRVEYGMSVWDWNGMEWNRMDEWNGMSRVNRMESNRIESNGIESNGMSNRI